MKLDHDFSFLDKKPPLYVGRIHFMRKVNVDKTVTVLNASWPLASALPDQGVWVTLTLAPTYATLQCFDSAPTASKQTLLAIHPFPIAEPILPRPGFTTAIV
ncbi:MAG: hypothetical protein R3A44_42650 [Caldilineaceae bacterium]